MGGMSRKEELGQMIAESLERWKYLHDNGGSDPFWPDGMNMNLVRNHIAYYKRQCQSDLAPEDFPPEYSSETPPEVDNYYMAQPDRIRREAEKSLEIFEADPNYKWLLEQVSNMSAKEIKDTAIETVIGYVSALRRYIQEDKLVDMRRYRTPDSVLEALRKCRERVNEFRGESKELPSGQLTLFDLGMM